jgi:iron complex transport system ATP-binding protein
MLRAEGISFTIGTQFLLNKTSVQFDEGQFHVIMGANGAGKSTLLKILAGHQKPSTGHVFFGEKELSSFSKKQLAQMRAVLSQHYHIAFPITVKDIVLMGRYPYYGQSPSKEDKLICEEAMQLMQVQELEQRDYNSLSGGEAQKVQMSRVLAQIEKGSEAAQKILFLDEPVSHLDLRYQHQLLQVAKELTRQSITVIAVLHDINLALSFADKILFMKRGEIMHEVGNPYEVTASIIQDIFDIKTQVLRVGDNAKPVVVF